MCHSLRTIQAGACLPTILSNHAFDRRIKVYLPNTTPARMKTPKPLNPIRRLAQAVQTQGAIDYARSATILDDPAATAAKLREDRDQAARRRMSCRSVSATACTKRRPFLNGFVEIRPSISAISRMCLRCRLPVHCCSLRRGLLGPCKSGPASFSGPQDLPFGIR